MNIFERLQLDAAKPDASEATHQRTLFCWASLQQDPRLRWLHAIPNANSQRQVAEGVRGGVSDVFLPYPFFDRPDQYYAGLYIELKTEKRRNQKLGGCSQDQLDFQAYASSVGYQCFICYGWEEARDRIMEYLNG